MEPRTSYGRPRNSSRGVVKELTPYFNWWRTTVIRDREIVDAEVAHEFRNSPELESALKAWEINSKGVDIALILCTIYSELEDWIRVVEFAKIVEELAPHRVPNRQLRIANVALEKRRMRARVRR